MATMIQLLTKIVTVLETDSHQRRAAEEKAAIERQRREKVAAERHEAICAELVLLRQCMESRVQPVQQPTVTLAAQSTQTQPPVESRRDHRQHRSRSRIRSNRDGNRHRGLQNLIGELLRNRSRSNSYDSYES